MKHQTLQTRRSPSEQSDLTRPSDGGWTPSDPVWKLLGEASEPEPGPFFARNVVRAARQTDQRRRPAFVRLAACLTPARLALGAAACACALMAWQLLPSTAPSVARPSTAALPPEEDQPADTVAMTDLSELVITETLTAAAEDPTIFTRDEVVSMLGL